MSKGSFIAIAVHHPDPEHTDEFVDFMHKVVNATEGAPGLVEFKALQDADGTFLAGFSRWENEDAFQAALPLIYSMAPLRKPEWSTKPDELIRLVDIPE